MKYIPSIAFEEMSGSAKGVTAAKVKSRKYIRNRGYGGSVRTADQAKVKSVFKMLTTMWKTLTNEQILEWNKLALSQSGRSVLGTSAKLSGSNLFTRLNFWVVTLGGQPMVTPPEINAVEAPSEATIVCSGETFTFKLNQAPYDNGGLYLVIEASEGQSNGVSRAHAKAAAIKMVEEPGDEVIDIRAEYVAKNGALNAAAPKVFFRYYFVDSNTGVKSQAMLAQVKWAADGSEQPAGGDNGGSQNQGGNSGQSTEQGGSSNSGNSGSQSGGNSGGSNTGGNSGGSQSGNVATPVITSQYDSMEGIRVFISGPEGAEIYYTTNGNDPTAESNHYNSSFLMGAGVTVKAIAILNGVSSAVASYLIPAADDEPGGDDH